MTAETGEIAAACPVCGRPMIREGGPLALVCRRCWQRVPPDVRRAYTSSIRRVVAYATGGSGSCPFRDRPPGRLPCGHCGVCRQALGL